MKGKETTRTIRTSPLTFKNWKWGLTNYYEMTGLADGGKTVDIYCLDFSKAFDYVLYKILIDKVFVYRLDGQRVRWYENNLNDQRVLIHGKKSSKNPEARVQYWVQYFSPSSLRTQAVGHLRKSAVDIRLGGMAGTPGSCGCSEGSEQFEKSAV